MTIFILKAIKINAYITTVFILCLY